MKMRFIATVFAPAWCASILAVEAPLSEQQVVRDALAENAPLKAAAAKWAAMKERVPQARAWEDPMIGVDFERTGTTQFTKYSDAEWMVSQTVPIAGKNLSRGRAAEAEALAAYEDVRRVRLDVLAKTKAAYFRLGNGYAQLAINRKNQGLLAQFVEVSKAKFAVGVRSQADVLAVQTDASKLDQERLRLEQELAVQQSALNVLLNRPATASLGIPNPLVFKPLRWSAAQLEPLMLAERPEIAGADRNIAAEEARRQLARREWIPDPQFRVEARHFQGSQSTFTEYDTGIFFSVPWVNFKKYSAGVREAERSVENARQTREGTKTEALGLLRDQLKKIDSLAAQYQLSQGKIVPLATQTVQSIEAAYRTDTAGYLEVLTAQRTLREAEAEASMQLTDYLVALAELDALVGVDAERRDFKAAIQKEKK
jgi:outer membrane protein TolC